METKQELLSKARENLQQDIPIWLDQAIEQKVDRFCGLPSDTLQPLFNLETVAKIESDFPSTISSSYLAIQDGLRTKKEDNTIIHCLEDLEYRLLALEIGRGINREGWKVLDSNQSSVIFIAHPKFTNAERFRDLLVSSERRQKKKIHESGMTEAFGLQEQPSESERQLFFFVDDGDFFRLIGADSLKDKFPVWWVTEAGDGIRIFYTKAKDGLDTVEKCTQNGVHETAHRFQKKILNGRAWEKLYFEFFLLEGMADWWAERLVRQEYAEPDFLQHYLINNRFMSSFVTSNELIASSFSYFRYPWNTVFSAMLFQRLAELEVAKNSDAGLISFKDSMEFNAEQVKRGLQIVTQNLSLANSLTERNGLLSANFLGELAQKLFRTGFGWDQMLGLYDKSGYNFAKTLLDKQALTEEEKVDLQKQTAEFRSKGK